MENIPGNILSLILSQAVIEADKDPDAFDATLISRSTLLFSTTRTAVCLVPNSEYNDLVTQHSSPAWSHPELYDIKLATLTIRRQGHFLIWTLACLSSIGPEFHGVSLHGYITERQRCSFFNSTDQSIGRDPTILLITCACQLSPSSSFYIKVHKHIVISYWNDPFHPSHPSFTVSISHTHRTILATPRSYSDVLTHHIQ
ncbi:hypothetical protein ARMSODRAFT_234686 [Armillaria solidipes]|uniref:Uncharacterized protein n=1 Tax=Armillaria solidipes TaxID=1076256 RepID=A0A2H3C0J1_9AGAR|nr:hypothetical protein ARMSODRAFT_234686 [Armillaria solidipes]